MNYLRNLIFGRASGTLQTQPQPDRDQVKNSAGGYVYALDPWARLDRFLILGSEGGTYYAMGRVLTAQNAVNVAECIRANGVRAVERVIEISTSGRTPKHDPAIFALAMAAGWGNEETRRLALGRGLQSVARTGSHLLQFASYVEQFRGWGRGLRRAIGDWYGSKPVDDLAYQLVKYQNRYGWTQRDLLRVAHPQTKDEKRNALYAWIAQKGGGEQIRLVTAFEQAKRMGTISADYMAAFVQEHELPREAIPSEWLREPAVWEALLSTMPMTALLRNIATMTRVGLLTPASAATKLVIQRLGDVNRITRSRVHPIAVLAALSTYQSGRSARGSATWKPVNEIVTALDEMFYLAFGNVEATNSRMLIGLDVSGSMSGGEIAGVPGLSPRHGSAAMTMLHARIEPNATVMAFTDAFVPLEVRNDETLRAFVERTSHLPFGRTDVSLPMLYALEKRLEIDTFVIYTDNETWAGTIHPDEALRRYRLMSGINAKLVVVAMTSTGFTVADPNDAGMLDVVGFDAAAPNLIADFVRG